MTGWIAGSFLIMLIELLTYVTYYKAIICVVYIFVRIILTASVAACRRRKLIYQSQQRLPASRSARLPLCLFCNCLTLCTWAIQEHRELWLLIYNTCVRSDVASQKNCQSEKCSVRLIEMQHNYREAIYSRSAK